MLVRWVQPKGRKKPYADTWVELENLHCVDLVRSYVLSIRESDEPHCCLPRRGDIDVMIGGPPCQGISGLNRQRDGSARGDVNTRMMSVWVDGFLLLQPMHGMKENVCDVLKFKGGKYEREVVQRIVEDDYQCSTTAISAASHGCPQGRVRVFIGAARSDQVLAPAPLPTFECPSGAQSVLETVNADRVLAVLPVGDPRAAALQRPATLADCMGDLPVVGNDDAYGSTHTHVMPAQSAMQVMLRQTRPGKKASKFVRNHWPAKLSKLQLARLECVKKPPAPGGDYNYRDLIAFANNNPDKGAVFSAKLGRMRARLRSRAAASSSSRPPCAQDALDAPHSRQTRRRLQIV